MPVYELFIVWNPDKEIFTIPGIDWPVRWYGLMWALAFIVSHFIMNRIYRTEKRTEKQLDTLTIYIILGTIIGARLGHCLFYDPEYYLANPIDILKVYEGGLASHGAAVGIVIAMWLYCRKTGESWLWLFDRLVVVVPLAGMFIRLGNLINSEIVGIPTSVPWAFVFPENDEDKINFEQMGVPPPPRHPAQLYEAVYCLFLFIFIYWFWKNRRNSVGPGFMFGLFCVVLFIERFLVEFLKINQSEFESNLPINMGQILSLPFIIAGIFMMWRAGKLRRAASG